MSKDVYYGKTLRKSFARSTEVMETDEEKEDEAQDYVDLTALVGRTNAL